MKLSRVIIYVADTIRIAEFYVKYFNMTPVGKWTVNWAEVEGHGFCIGFHKAYDENGPIDTNTGSACHPHKLVFTVADVESVRARFIEEGIKMDDILKDEEAGNLVLCDGFDIEGHRFQLCNQ